MTSSPARHGRAGATSSRVIARDETTAAVTMTAARTSGRVRVPRASATASTAPHPTPPTHSDQPAEPNRATPVVTTTYTTRSNVVGAADPRNATISTGASTQPATRGASVSGTAAQTPARQTSTPSWAHVSSTLERPGRTVANHPTSSTPSDTHRWAGPFRIQISQATLTALIERIRGRRDAIAASTIPAPSEVAASPTCQSRSPDNTTSRVTR